MKGIQDKASYTGPGGHPDSFQSTTSPARFLVTWMYVLDQRVLNVLKSRATWQKGKVRMSMNELQDLLASRFPQDGRPRKAEIQAAVRRLVRMRLVSWALTTNDGICYVL
jgi:hypothetical protein